MIEQLLTLNFLTLDLCTAIEELSEALDLELALISVHFVFYDVDDFIARKENTCMEIPLFFHV